MYREVPEVSDQQIFGYRGESSVNIPFQLIKTIEYVGDNKTARTSLKENIWKITLNSAEIMNIFTGDYQFTEKTSFGNFSITGKSIKKSIF